MRTRACRQLLLALLLAGCSNTLAPADAFKSGVRALEAGDARTARVQFLNVIKEHPADKAARIMQARTYLALGDGTAAESEIDRARQLGVAASLTRPLKAHALLIEGRAADALEELNGASGAYAERIRGRALAALGRTAEASQAFDRAIALAPSDSELLTDLARFRRSAGDLGGALEAADKAVGANPRNVEAITLRGELTRSQYGLRAALPWFDRAIQIDERYVTAHLERAATLGDIGATHEMLAETRRVFWLSPGNPLAYYLQAMLAARARNYALARSLYQRTQGKLDGQPSAMLLASAIDYAVGDPQIAAERLSRLLDMQPDNAKVRRLLAAAQWKSGKSAAVVETLRPFVDRPDADSYSLRLYGNALARSGDRDSASVYLARAANPAARSATALIGAPVDSARLAVLRGDAGLRPADAEAQVSLIRALLASGYEGEALDRARRLAEVNPGAPDVYLLVGDCLGVGGDAAGAAEQYRHAANIAFTGPVAMRLVDALERSGQRETAARVLSLFLQQNPGNVPAQLLAAARLMEARQWADATHVYERLRAQLGDSDAMMLNNLAWAYWQQGDKQQALGIARRAWLLDRSNPVTADTLGWLLVKAGTERIRGLALLAQAARDAPDNAQIRDHFRIASGG